ncbi:peptide ABC transporter substrate-binding protein [Micromonospora qiuiae]|uniref:Peptide ABC transporter substrate-binding protein n=1 Tax=Micromonospora qiuiae TaxID=502268 RepID=A0ABQ4JHM1_9ACTN|nr:ABC transporter substrate-binding protein [Micromonospora qiuiae]GIJ30077.1 peptide ABC transporter substrate-binding protein [Micromonospora qiuiae]
MNRLTIKLPAVLLATALALTACSGGGDSNTTKGDSGSGTVTLGAYLEPVSLDLTAEAGAAIPQVLLYNVYEGLVRQDADTGEVKPLLANEWAVSDDGTEYTFTLRDGVTFHDGQKLTAQDVVWSFKRVTEEGSTNPFKSQMAVVSAVEAPDESTVVVTLSRPSQSWLADIAGRVGVVLKEGATDLATQPNGTGPLKFEKWNRGDSITLVRNDGYWGEPARVGQAVFRYITDPNALNNAMLSGQLDIVANIQAPQLLEVFKGNQQFEVVEGVTTGEVVLAMNNSKGPLADVRVRQAIRHAIDHQALVDTVWSGYGTLIGSMVPPSDPWFEDRTGDFPHDPAKAKQLLAAAGHANGLTLTMDVPPPGYARSSAQFVASQLAEVGITVTQNNVEMPQWLDKVLGQANYDLSIIAHVEPRDLVRYGQPDYYYRYNNPAVTQLMNEADTALDAAVRDKKYAEAARIISEEAASDWLFLLPNLAVIRQGVTGYPKDAVTQSFDVTKVSKSN